MRLAPGAKAAYHAAAVLAAGGFVALLDAIAELGRVAGLDEAGSLAIYGRLIEGTLGNARALGIAAALTGPITRGDVGTLRVAPRCAPRARAARPRAVRRGGPARDRARRGAWRPRTGGRPDDARYAGWRSCAGRLNGYHWRPMEHSIAAKYAARPAARFVRPSNRVRERRLGLRPAGSFRAPGMRATVLHGPDVAPLTRLRAGWRSIQPARSLHSAERPARSTGRDAVGPLRALRGRASPPGRHIGAVARLRPVDRHVRRRDRHPPRRPDVPWLVVGSRRRERDGWTWTLPKGTPKPGETREETALREVAEETGLEVRITGPLDSIEYWFVQSGQRIHKTVHYFLMDPIGGDLAGARPRVRAGPLGHLRRGEHAADLRDRARPRGTGRASCVGERTSRRPAPGSAEAAS